jgi:hypothetical protein
MSGNIATLALNPKDTSCVNERSNWKMRLSLNARLIGGFLIVVSLAVIGGGVP